MKELRFSYNWNGKLKNECFTTIRLNGIYEINEKVQIKLKDEVLGNAVVIGKYVVKIENISEYVARLDTGYSKLDTIQLILKMYSNLGLKKSDEVIVYLLKYEYVK